jgi:hypothetical protein
MIRRIDTVDPGNLVEDLEEVPRAVSSAADGNPAWRTSVSDDMAFRGKRQDRDE